jgi:hypothetical protein
MLTIKTVTPRYDEIEDRIRLSINHMDSKSRIDFILTRKFILKLLPSYEEYMFKVYYEKMQNESTTTTPKYKSIRISDHSKLAPYQENPELLQSIQFSFQEKNDLTILKFGTKYTEATATLNYESLTNIFALIRSTIPHFDWGISPRI